MHSSKGWKPHRIRRAVRWTFSRSSTRSASIRKRLSAAVDSHAGADRLPSKLTAAYPAALFKALALLRDADVCFAEIERLGRSDQVFASSLLSVANAALYSPVSAIKSIGRAITHIGADAAKKVILAVAARPLFASANLRMLWQHSLEVATIAEKLGHTSNAVDSCDAFVAGLIHDIGRVAIETLPRDTVETHHRIAEDAECVVLADLVAIGSDHGRIRRPNRRGLGLAA